MALSQPRSSFGIHSVTPYSRTTGLPYGIIKVLAGSSISLEAELIDLFGGSNKYPWASEVGTITSEMSLQMREIPNFAFELFLGTAPTENAAEANGAVDVAFANKNGTSVFSATTGVATATVKSGQEGDLKFNHYVVKAVSSTTVDVYALTDVQFARGDDNTYQNDALKITSSALTIATGAAVEITNTGIELTGGSGTIGMTTGDTAIFSTRPQNTTSSEVKIGGSGATFPEWGALIVAAQRGTNECFEVEAYRCIAAGLPLGFQEKAWQEVEVTVKLLYDSTEDAVFRFHYADAT